ncbi:hypothetical protein [Bacillus sp. AK128]
MKKLLLLAIIVIPIILLVMFFRSSDPIQTISDVRDGIAINIEEIDQVETEDGVIVYSVGESNSGDNYMYSVDQLRKSITGYKWLGGGGHVNQDVPLNKEFALSLQLFNEKQNIVPTIFGVRKDQDIKKINVSTLGESVDAVMHRGPEGEMFYVVHFSRNVVDSTNFQIIITYKNDTSLAYVISSDEEISKLQEGMPFYLNKMDFK